MYVQDTKYVTGVNIIQMIDGMESNIELYWLRLVQITFFESNITVLDDLTSVICYQVMFSTATANGTYQPTSTSRTLTIHLQHYW